MKSSVHATVAVVVADGTAARLLPLHLHHNCRLRPRHTIACWSGPRPLPLIGWCTSRSSPRTSTPLHGVAQGRSCVIHGWGSWPNQVRPVHGPFHQAISGRRRRRRRRQQVPHLGGHRPVGASSIRWTTRISIGPRGRPQGPLAPHTVTTPPTSPTTSLVAPGLPSALPSSEAGPSGSGTPSDLKSMCGIGCSVGSPTTPPHSAKAEPPGRGTRRTGLAGERAEEEGEWCRGTWMSG
jgi:hypothetical protein